MKACLIILFALLSATLAAPPSGELVIIRTEAINPYTKIWEAVCQIESGNNPFAYNPIESASGIAQIRDMRLIEYNARFKKCVSQNSLFDPETSKSIFMSGIGKYNPSDIKAIAVYWNGKSTTNKYYQRLKRAISMTKVIN